MNQGPHAVVGLLWAALIFLVGWGVMSPPAAKLDTHEQGRAVYNFRCYFCHGYSGDAKTLAATYLQPPPRDFSAASLT